MKMNTKIDLPNEGNDKLRLFEEIKEYTKGISKLIKQNQQVNYAKFFNDLTAEEKEYIKTLLNEIKDNVRDLNISANYWSKNINNRSMSKFEIILQNLQMMAECANDLWDFAAAFFVEEELNKFDEVIMLEDVMSLVDNCTKDEILQLDDVLGDIASNLDFVKIEMYDTKDNTFDTLLYKVENKRQEIEEREIKEYEEEQRRKYLEETEEAMKEYEKEQKRND